VKNTTRPSLTLHCTRYIAVLCFAICFFSLHSLFAHPILPPSGPVITGVPKDTILACGQPIPIATPTTDGDCKPIQLTFQDVTTIGTCPLILVIKRTWKAVDSCGVEATVVQTISIEDKVAPVAQTLPTDITLGCGDSSVIVTPSFQDACDTSLLKISLKQDTLLGKCPGNYKIKRTWTATDKCGNSASIIQNVSVEDTTPPIFDTIVQDVTVDLSKNQTLPVPPIVTATDACSTIKPKIAYVQAGAGNNASCQTILTRTWTAIDTCGNKATLTQKITITDKLPILSKVKPFNDTFCIKKTYTFVPFTPDTSYFVPTGYELGFVLVKDKIVVDRSNFAFFFQVKDLGVYTIHEIIYNPNSNPLDSIQLGTTTLKGLEQTLVQAGGTTCASLDTLGSEKIWIVKCPPPKNCTPPTVTNTTILPATCGKANGSILLTLPDKADLYYNWSPNVSTNFAASSIAAGVYTLTVTSPYDSTCFTVKTFTVSNVGAPKVDLPITTAATCGAKDGSATFVNAALTYKWEDTKTLATRKDLGAGSYKVTVTEKDNVCPAVVAVQIDKKGNIKATAKVTKEPDCNKANGAVTILTNSKGKKIKFSWGADSIRTDLAAGFYQVAIADTAGCVGSVAFTLQNKTTNFSIQLKDSLVKISCIGKIDGKITYTLSDSTATVKILGNKGGEYTNGSLGAGDYFLVATTKDSCVAASKAFKVIAPDELTLSFTQANGDCYKLGTITASVFGGIAPYKFDWLDLKDTAKVEPLSRTNLPAGLYTLNITDANGCKTPPTTAIITSDCKGSTRDTLSLDVRIKTTRTFQFPVLSLFDAAQTTFVLADTVKKKSTYGEWSLSSKGLLTYKANSLVGNKIDTICTYATFKGKIDTTCLLVSTFKDSIVKGLIVRDILVGDSVLVCLDTIVGAKGPFTFKNVCLKQKYNYFEYITDAVKRCVRIEGTKVGSDTICMQVCSSDSLKKCDTTKILINVFPRPSIDTIRVIIEEGVTDSTCFTVKGLKKIYSVFDYCGNLSGTHATIKPNGKKTCVTYTGIKAGEDQACLMISDTASVSDTVIFIVKVIPPDSNALKPLASNDSTNTKLNKGITINVLANDSLRNGTLIRIGIVKKATYGKAKVNPDNTFIYEPEKEYCGQDTFIYFVQNTRGYDTAQVVINITCDSLVIKEQTGFSPNNDAVNDTWKIKGIEAFPDAEIIVYNRWGNQVFKTLSYDNDQGWDGKWEGNELPEGTYYYVIRLTSKRKPLTGYIYLSR
jgi:gliding motility-associated-like protein